MGLLLADGHVSKTNQIMLTMKDLDIIQKYQKALKTNIPIKIDRYNNYYLNIGCKHMTEVLRLKGFNNRKSYYIDFDKVISFIAQPLLHHFIRGMFDGDGSIQIYKYDYIKNPQYHFGYTGLKNVVDYIKQYLNIQTKTVIESNLTYTCVTSCKQTIENIYDILYKDATVYIDRKYQTFQKIIQRDLQRL